MFQGLEKRKACFLEHSSPCLSCTGTSKMVLHAFQDCFIITTPATRDLKPIFAPRLYQSERGLSTTGIWPLARRLKLCFSSKFQFCLPQCCKICLSQEGTFSNVGTLLRNHLVAPQQAIKPVQLSAVVILPVYIINKAIEQDCFFFRQYQRDYKWISAK